VKRMASSSKAQSVVARLLLLALAATLLMVACQPSSDEKVEQTISFNQHYDTLSQFDSVLITLKDLDGHTLDVVFHGKVAKPDDIEYLPAPHWDGGKVTISITGYNGQRVVYKIEIPFDGNTDKRDSSRVLILPTSKLLCEATNLKMMEGDSLPLPQVSVLPNKLVDKSLSWSSSNPEIVVVRPEGFEANKAGSSIIRVVLVSDTSKSITINITVISNPNFPESLKLNADTIFLAANGAAGRLAAQITPSSASKELDWRADDSSVVRIFADGSVKGLKAGVTRLRVRSALKPSILDSAVIVVSPPVPVDRVIFSLDSIEIFQGGGSESLAVTVLPPKSNPEVKFRSDDSAIIRIDMGRVVGLRIGSTSIIATSAENPFLADTLKVSVVLKQNVDSLRIDKKVDTIYTGGEDPLLNIKVWPSTTTPKVIWRSTDATIAKVSENGKITGVDPGHVRIYAISIVDSTKMDSCEIFVRTDPPRLYVGRPDTIVSLGQSVMFHPVVAPQEYGSIVQFKWDLDGIPGWDDSGAAVIDIKRTFDKETNYSLRFYVRDTEGNETIINKIVTVVSGLVVLIVSPLDGAYFPTPTVRLVWSVDGKIQDTANEVILKDGENLITRSAKDAAGKVFSSSIRLTLDSVPPLRPVMHGIPLINSKAPTWSWMGGGGGNGVFRYSLDGDDFSKATETKDTDYTPAMDLAEGSHTLSVQERDLAGNWSPSGRFAIKVDVTPPKAPTIKISPNSPSNNPKPTWSWSSSGGEGAGIFRFRLDSSDLKDLGEVTTKSFTPNTNLSEGFHKLYVQERDSAGNWSASAESTIEVDLTPPNPPVLSSNSYHTTNLRPNWRWTTGGNGGSGDYRFKLDDSAFQAEANGKTDTSFSPSFDFASGSVHILYVQERDIAGNWSALGRLALHIHGLVGFAVGDGGVICKTTNAGVTWDTLPRIITDHLTSVHFPDISTGYAVSDAGTIVKIYNGTTSAVTMTAGPSHLPVGFPAGVYFTDGNTGFAACDSRIVGTKTGGAIWDTLSIASGGRSIFFTDNQTGYITSRKTVLKSTDAGVTWAAPREGMGSVPGTLISAFFPDSKHGYAVGFYSMSKTDDGGESWKPLSGSFDLASVFFTDAVSGYAVGSGGVIIKTNNGGISWDPCPNPSAFGLHSIYFIDAKTGFAVGDNGTILKTTDGGASWNLPAGGSGTTFNLSSVYFP
jgi:photosystem II stability/assembly factor-like uncharacterized protein/uncharacterized protein YjdB